MAQKMSAAAPAGISFSPVSSTPMQLGPGGPYQLQGTPQMTNSPTGQPSSYYDMSSWNLPGYTPPTDTFQQVGNYGKQMLGQVPQAQTASQLTAAGMAADQNLPEYLRISAGQNLVSPDTLNKFVDQWHQQYAAPQEAQMQAQLQQRGRMDSTFGGAQMGAMQSANTFQGMQAGLQLQQNALQNWLQGRQSFFGNEGQMAANANNLAVNRGMGMANTAASFYGNLNNSANNYNLQAYQSMLQAQQQAAQSNFQNTQAINQNKLQQQQLQMQNRVPGAISFTNNSPFY